MMDFHHIMMLIHHKLYDSYKLYYCQIKLKLIGIWGFGMGDLSIKILKKQSKATAAKCSLRLERRQPSPHCFAKSDASAKTLFYFTDRYLSLSPNFLPILSGQKYKTQRYSPSTILPIIINRGSRGYVCMYVEHVDAFGQSYDIYKEI